MVGRIIVQKEKSRRQRTAGRTRSKRFRRRSIFPLQNSAFTVFPSGTNSLCTTPSESKKVINMILMRDLWNFTFFGRGDISPTHSEFCCLFRGHRQNNRSHLPLYFFKRILVCIGHRDDILAKMWLDLPFAQVPRSVEQNVHTIFSFPNPLSKSEELQSWEYSKIVLLFLMKFDGHFYQISNSSNVYLSSIRFWTVISLGIFYQLPSVSKSRIPPKNVWSVQILIPISLLNQY